MFAENIPTAGEIVQYDIQNEAMETNKIDLSTAHLNTHLQKQPPEMFFKKGVFKNFAKLIYFHINRVVFRFQYSI